MRDMGGLHLIEVSQCRSPLRRVARIPKVHENCVRPVAQARLFKRATKYSLFNSSALSCQYANVWICGPKMDPAVDITFITVCERSFPQRCVAPPSQP